MWRVPWVWLIKTKEKLTQLQRFWLGFCWTGMFADPRTRWLWQRLLLVPIFPVVISLGSHTGALIVIHKFVPESSYWHGCQYPVPWTVTFRGLIRFRSAGWLRAFTSLCLDSGIHAGMTGYGCPADTCA